MALLQFKFYFVNERGEKASFLAKKGALEEERLVLDTSEIPTGAIVDADVRGEYLVLTVPHEEGAASIVISTGKAKQIKEELGRLRSKIWAELHRKELESQGAGHAFRSRECPSCGAVLDLSGLDDTPQVSCDFCHTISTIRGADGEPKNEIERGFRLCDECGMYSYPRKFSIFYFYFLLFLWGVRSGTTWRCPGCMRGEAWKMLFGNLIFILGVPVALVQLFRSYGGTNIGQLYAGLDGANLRACRGDLVGAIESYQKILARHPISAGVKFNLGLAFLRQRDYDEAAKMFEFALADCANYQPAVIGLAQSYRELGETDRLEELKTRYGLELSPTSDTTAEDAPSETEP